MMMMMMKTIVFYSKTVKLPLFIYFGKKHRESLNLFVEVVDNSWFIQYVLVTRLVVHVAFPNPCY